MLRRSSLSPGSLVVGLVALLTVGAVGIGAAHPAPLPRAPLSGGTDPQVDCGPGNGSLRVCLVGDTHVALGSSVEFWANASGATVPLKFTWNEVGATHLINATSDSMTYMPTADGLYSVNVTVTDDRSNHSGAFLLVEATGPSPVSVTVAYAQESAENAVTFTANVSGGTGPYSYEWMISGTAPFTGTGPNLTIQDLNAGPYTVTVAVTDARGFVGSGSLAVEVVPPPAAADTEPTTILLLAALGAGIGLLVVVGVLVWRRRSAGRGRGQP